MIILFFKLFSKPIPIQRIKKPQSKHVTKDVLDNSRYAY